MDEYENLRKNVLEGNNIIGTGAHGNVDAYLKAVYTLNENYAGLVSSFHGGMGGPGYGTGLENLLDTEISVDVKEPQRNGAQVAGLTANELRDRMKQDNQMSSTEGWARDVEGRAKGSSDLIQGLRMTYNPPLKDTRTEGLQIFGGNGDIKDTKAAGKGATEDTDAQSGGSTQSGQIMAGALLLGAVTSELPPVAAVVVAGGAVAAAAVYAYEKIGGKSGFHTTYQPASQNPIHTPRGGIDPENPNWIGAAKWAGATKLLYEIYDNYKDNFNNINLSPLKPAVRDNTYVSPTIGPARR